MLHPSSNRHRPEGPRILIFMSLTFRRLCGRFVAPDSAWIVTVVGRQLRGRGLRRIGMDTAQANGNGYMWPTGNTGQRHGKFYARVGKTSYCAGT